MTKKELEIQKSLGLIPKTAELHYCGICNDTTPQIPVGAILDVDNEHTLYRRRVCCICDNTKLYWELDND